MPRPRLLLLPLVTILFGGAAAPADGATVVRSASGSNAAAIDSAVNNFRSDVAASPSDDATWDDLTAAPSNPFTYQALTLSTTGSGFTLDGSHSSQAYSPPNLLQTNGDTTVDFVEPGTSTPGVSRGFGAVFSNVTATNTSKIELLGANGATLSPAVAAPQGSLSFVGISVTDPRVVEVRITTAGALLDNLIYARPQPDPDRDGIPSAQDNCPTVANPGQENVDKDAQGDACDPDADNDGVPNSRDAFPLDRSETTDTDGDGIGDNKDADDDNDGLTDATEGALGTDPKRADTDGDGVLDGQDNCPTVPNPTQADANGDGRGDACTDLVAPVLSGLQLRPATFRRGSKYGTRVSFRLSEAGSVRLTVLRLVTGHRAGPGCARGLPRRNRHERPCRFFSPVRGAIERAATSGTNFVKLEGRIGGSWMKTGRYMLVAGATDRAGNPAARTVRATFTVVP